MTFDDDSVTECLFHPRPEDDDFSPKGLPTQTQVDGATVGGYLHLNHQSDVLLLFFHGNGEIAADYDSVSSVYTSCGVSLWVVDFRGYGRSTGHPSFSHMIRDAVVLLDDAARLARSTDSLWRKVIVMGRSLGSAPALHLAAERADCLKGLVLDSPYAYGPDLVDMLGGPAIDRHDIEGFCDNIDRMRQHHLASLIIHGTWDMIIPIADARALYEASDSESKELITIDGAGHNDLLSVGRRQYFEGLKAFVA